MTTRRKFLATSIGATSSLWLGVRWARATEGPFRPNAYVEVFETGRVRVTVPRSEMGQGVRTALPMLVAEELDLDWDEIDLRQAAPGEGIDDLGTGGSDSIESCWRPLRQAGAAAREMLVGAAAELWQVPPDECRTRLGKVLHESSARSLSYGALVGRASGRAVPKNPRLKDPGSFRYLGKPKKRADGGDIVRGEAVYGFDAQLPGMRVATVLRPPSIDGRLKTFDASRALALPGVRRVFPIPTGLAIVADDSWLALKARDLVTVAWEHGSHFDSADFEKVLQEAVSVPGIETLKRGDTTRALEGAARRLQAVYYYPFQTHAPIEPMSYIVSVEAGRCILLGGTQHPDRVRKAVSERLNVAMDRVEVRPTLIGGAFGRRLVVDHVLEAVEVALVAREPVQVIWTRPDDMKHGRFHPATANYMEAGLDASGNPIAWLHRKAGPLLSAPYGPTANERTDPAFLRGVGWGQYDVPYSFPNVLTELRVVDSPVNAGPWRSVFSPSSTLAREYFVDEIAHASGRDPLAFRLELLAGPPILEAGNTRIDRVRYRRVLDLVAEKALWGKPLAEDGKRRRGRGIAGNVYDGETTIAYVVEVSVGPEGDVRVDRIVCAADCGFAVNPLGVEGQIESGLFFGLSAALKGEITFADGCPEQSTFSDYPVMSQADAPEIEIHLLEGASSPSGLGEPPVPPIAPAVLNAIFAATGRRLRRVPVRPKDLLAGEDPPIRPGLSS